MLREACSPYARSSGRIAMRPYVRYLGIEVEDASEMAEQTEA